MLGRELAIKNVNGCRTIEPVSKPLEKCCGNYACPFSGIPAALDV
jgi:hypothetical protein